MQFSYNGWYLFLAMNSLSYKSNQIARFFSAQAFTTMANSIHTEWCTKNNHQIETVLHLHSSVSNILGVEDEKKLDLSFL